MLSRSPRLWQCSESHGLIICIMRVGAVFDEEGREMAV